MIRVSETVYSLDAFFYGIKVILEDQVSLFFLLLVSFLLIKIVLYLFLDSNIELRRIDWLHEKISSTHYIVVLNDVEVRLYDKLPSSWTEWEKPQHVLPLLGTRSILEKG